MKTESPDQPRNLISLKCHCGEFHVIDLLIPEWNYFYQTVEELGEYTTVHLIHTNKKYSVQRIYIAVHGMKAKELPKLGFKEV